MLHYKSVITLLIITLSLHGCLANFQEGDFIPTARKARFHGVGFLQLTMLYDFPKTQLLFVFRRSTATATASFFVHTFMLLSKPNKMSPFPQTPTDSYKLAWRSRLPLPSFWRWKPRSTPHPRTNWLPTRQRWLPHSIQLWLWSRRLPLAHHHRHPRSNHTVSGHRTRQIWRCFSWRHRHNKTIVCTR